jgi:hypothetical protein
MNSISFYKPPFKALIWQQVLFNAYPALPALLQSKSLLLILVLRKLLKMIFSIILQIFVMAIFPPNHPYTILVFQPFNVINNNVFNVADVEVKVKVALHHPSPARMVRVHVPILRMSVASVAQLIASIAVGMSLAFQKEYKRHATVSRKCI